MNPPVVISGPLDWDNGVFFDVVFRNPTESTRSWEGKARLDTGLGQTWLSEFLIQQLGLPRLKNKALLPDPTGGTSIIEEGAIHLACISVPMNNPEDEEWVLEEWPVFPLPETAPGDAIIGRDILRQGDLETFASGNFTFVVRRPLAYNVEASGGVEER